MLEILISGIIQGVLEWLPVSSQGMISLFLLKNGYSLSQATDIAFMLHSGTLLAIIVYFWNDFKKILKPESGFDLRVLLFLIWSTIISVIIGVPFYLLLNNLELLSSTGPKIIGGLLIIMGLIQSSRKELGIREANTLNWKDGALTGLLQGFSALPGVSRSGITTLALLTSGFNIETALKYSFIAGIPIIFGVQIVEMIKGVFFQPTYIIGAIVSFLVGIASISYFLKLARKINFALFCIIVGLLTIFL